jgi:MYXO-CTERM domain-containing protein
MALRHILASLGFAGLLAVLCPASAHARAGGIASDGCSGCHTGNSPPMVTTAISPDPPTPGAMATFTLSFPSADGGIYLRVSKGTLINLPNEGTRSGGSDQAIIHSSPKRAVGGTVTFRVGWMAPATPGGVDFDAYLVAGNGNGARDNGDSYVRAFYSTTYGCAAKMFYRDFDGDGVGSVQSGYTKDCAKPMYYSDVIGDCNDSDERIFPGQKEACNGRDDNCNGMVDEGLGSTVMVYPDADGDKHGDIRMMDKGMMIVGCNLPAGYGFGADDCDDKNPAVYTGAKEVCDYIDNDCNGRIDENARVTCGEGWCRRAATSCSPDSCTPGDPRPEMCNAFDDDCDGINDNGTDLELCGTPGLQCVNGACVPAGSVPDAGVRPGTGAAGAGAAGTGAAGTGAAATGASGSGGPGPVAGMGGGAAGASGEPRPTSGCAMAGDSRGAGFALLAILVGAALRRRRSPSAVARRSRASGGGQ